MRRVHNGKCERGEGSAAEKPHKHPAGATGAICTAQALVPPRPCHRAGPGPLATAPLGLGLWCWWHRAGLGGDVRAGRPAARCAGTWAWEHLHGETSGGPKARRDLRACRGTPNHAWGS